MSDKQLVKSQLTCDVSIIR